MSLISFGLTWLAMGVIALLGRGSRQRVQVAGRALKEDPR